MTPLKRKFIIAALVALTTFMVYLPALQNAFVNWDDDVYVYGNFFIRSIDIKLFGSAFLGFHAGYWLPLIWISHALDYAIWGLNPLGHHLTNNILHAINTFLVVLLVVRLIGSGFGDSCSSGKSGTLPNDHRKRPYFPSGSPVPSPHSRSTLIAAGATGLLFGLHPIHVESVAWVAERKDLLCALFYLLSVMAYVRYAVTTLFSQETKFDHRGTETQRDSNIQIRNRLFSVTPCLCGSFSLHRYYLLSLLFFTLALMSKPMAVSLPVVLLILDWYPLKRIQSLRTLRAALFEKLPFIAFSIISSILTVLAQKAAGSIASIESVPLSARALLAVKSPIAYLWKMILPLNLIPFYPYPEDLSPLSLDSILPIVLAAGITVTGFALVRKQKLWLAVWGYFIVTLLPVLGLVQAGSQAMADRFTYLPSIGPFLIFGLLAAGVYKRVASLRRWKTFLQTAGLILAGVMLVSLSYATIKQIGVWRNSLVLWNYVIGKEPLRSPSAHYNLGNAYFSKGLSDMASRQYQITLGLKPDYSAAHFNLGVIYLNNGSIDMARREFELVLGMRPDDDKARELLNSIIARSNSGDTIPDY